MRRIATACCLAAALVAGGSVAAEAKKALLTRKQRKGCKRLPGWDRLTCLMGRRPAVLR